MPVNGSSSKHQDGETAANAAGQPPQSKILTIAYPVSADESDRQKIGAFLEHCHYCTKRIANDSEVFMYGNFGAFCSAECRDNQITMDHSAEKQPAANLKAKDRQGS